MQITDIKIRKLFQEGPMKAIVSVTFDGQLAVHDIKVINAREKFFIVRGALEQQVLAAYEEALTHPEDFMQPVEEVAEV